MFLDYKANGTPLAAKYLGDGAFIVMVAIEHGIGDHVVIHYHNGKPSWNFAYGYCRDYGTAEQLFEQKCK